MKQAIENYTDCCEDVFVVLPEGRGELRRIVEQTNANVIINSKPSLGMSQSIVAGVLQTPEASGWLIALADMPFIKQATIKEMLRCFEKRAIVRPVYKDKVGHPVYFDKKYKAMLCALEGDQGARDILGGLENEISYLDVDDQGVLQDVDTLEDLAKHIRG